MKAHINYWREIHDSSILLDLARATVGVWRKPLGYFLAAAIGGLFIWGVAR